jgi:hypothetical protein
MYPEFDMRGYAYIDNDGNIGVRSEAFIDIEDPGFWSRNAHLIDTVWKFDTEDESSMIRILTSFKNREMNKIRVEEFCSQIGFNLVEFINKKKVVQLPFPTQLS